VIEDGDAVVAFGNLFESEDPPRALLCPMATGWYPDFGCIGTVFVPVDGVDIFDLPGREAQPHASSVPEQAWITWYVRVDGIWSEGAIQATRAERTDSPSVAEYLDSLIPRQPEIPCEPPDGGCADFSDRELQEVVDSLTAMNRTWDLYIDAPISRVVVHVPVFDRSTADAIRPYENKVVVRHIVSPAAD